MTYIVDLSKEARRQLDEWMKSGQKKVLIKIYKLLAELREHPTTGTGQVEQLKGNLAGMWRRRIDKSSRMIYSIEEEKVIVTVIPLKGHYGN